MELCQFIFKPLVPAFLKKKISCVSHSWSVFLTVYLVPSKECVRSVTERKAGRGRRREWARAGHAHCPRAASAVAVDALDGLKPGGRASEPFLHLEDE